jgi:hypothetical protein
MGDHVDMSHASQHTDDADKDLHGMVASLSDDQKGKLKNILNNQMADPSGISKGNPSSEEQGHIADAAAEEHKENDLINQDEGHAMDPDQSDAIAKSMLDSRHLGENPPTGKPRNLGERMKMSVMNKLKAKGKL